MKKKISLALGGGGSKGNAHIGVLRAIDKENIEIIAIAGSSIGGLIAAVYLVGNTPDEIEERLANTEFRRLFRRGPNAKNSLLGLAGVAELLTETIGDTTFNQLPIPLALTAVDLITGQEIVLKDGRLMDAVFATIAVPGIFPPKEYKDYELVDGGLSNPVPVSIVRSLAPKYPVVAVVLSSPPNPEVELSKTNLVLPLPALERMSRFRLAQAFNIFTRAITISGRLLTELRLEIDKPDLIIRPSVDHIGLLDRVDVHEVVKLGEDAANRKLPILLRNETWLSKTSSRISKLVKIKNKRN
jgi:NTE family protein